MFTQAWCQPVAWSSSGKVGTSLLRFVPDQRGLRIRVVSVCGCITERVRLCFSMYFGGQRQEKLQWLTFPGFRGTQFQIIPCATVWVEIGSRDPTLLLCSADKPPTCGKIRRLKITRSKMIYKHATECITQQGTKGTSWTWHARNWLWICEKVPILYSTHYKSLQRQMYAFACDRLSSLACNLYWITCIGCFGQLTRISYINMRNLSCCVANSTYNSIQGQEHKKWCL